MSLLDEAMESCVIINTLVVDDDYGGIKTTYQDGAHFDAAVVLDSSIQAKIAEAQGVTGLYTVTTRKNINLQFHQVFRRERDGKIFRVTSDGDDKRTPNSATLNMRQVSAEEWRLINGQSTGNS